MTTPGLRVETAASVILRDAIHQHMRNFALVIRQDLACNRSVSAAYIDGLSGALALTIAGGHGSKEDVLNATIKTLRECVDRDLRFMATGQ